VLRDELLPWFFNLPDLLSVTLQAIYHCVQAKFTNHTYN
jgi:hypothetical protein